MQQDNIMAGIVAVLRQHLGVVEPVTLATRIQADLAFDSVQQLTFVIELENSFQLCFEPEDEAGLQTLGDIVRYIENVHRRLVAAPAAGTAPFPVAK